MRRPPFISGCSRAFRTRFIDFFPLSIVLFAVLFTPLSTHAAIDNLVRESSIAVNLSAPSGIAVDSAGGIYVSESGRNRLLVFSPGGVYLSQLTGLDKPLGVAVGADGRIYVCNAGRRSVEVYSSALNFLFKLGAGNGEFDLPVSVALGSGGDIYVADAKACVVKVYLSNGAFRFSFGGSGSGDGKFHFPTSVSIDHATGRVVVSDLQLTPSGTRGARVQVFDGSGGFIRKFGVYDLDNCNLDPDRCLVRPVGTAVDAGGRIYVSDAFMQRVLVFDGSGAYVKSVSDANRPLRTPLGIAVNDGAGKLYVASLNSSTVEVYGSGAASGSGSLTFSGSGGGGGGCSIAGRSAGSSASAWGFLVPFFILLLGLLPRKAR